MEAAVSEIMEGYETSTLGTARELYPQGGGGSEEDEQ